MCNLYSLTKGQASIHEALRTIVGRTSNLLAMPVILTTPDELEAWMTAPAGAVPALQRPLPDGALRVVARRSPRDGLVADHPGNAGHCRAGRAGLVPLRF